MRTVFLLSVWALLAIPLLSQISDGPGRTFSARDLFGLRVASDPQVRPDGGAIAYVRVTYDISTDRGEPSIWIVDPATGAQSPLVVDERANFAPRWSPEWSATRVCCQHARQTATTLCPVDRDRTFCACRRPGTGPQLNCVVA